MNPAGGALCYFLFFTAALGFEREAALAGLLDFFGAAFTDLPADLPADLGAALLAGFAAFFAGAGAGRFAGAACDPWAACAA